MLGFAEPLFGTSMGFMFFLKGGSAYAVSQGEYTVQISVLAREGDHPHFPPVRSNGPDECDTQIRWELHLSDNSAQRGKHGICLQAFLI